MAEKKRLAEVRLRNGFSDRMGIKKENVEVQIGDLDERTRIAIVNDIDFLWNVLVEDNHRKIYLTPNSIEKSRNRTDIINRILSKVYSKKVDHSIVITNYRHNADEFYYNTILNDQWHNALDVIEFVIQELAFFSDTCGIKVEPYKFLNDTFEKEFVGYRFIDGIITPIIDELEIEELETALSTPYSEVNGFLKNSLRSLSNRDAPDYEHSIKESITAVERICSIIVDDPTATLGRTLKKLEDAGLAIHPSLKSAFNKLYGYTTDAAGIRHAGQLGGPESTFEEAKFMLVTCCAFVNYLIGTMGKLHTVK